MRATPPASPPATDASAEGERAPHRVAMFVTVSVPLMMLAIDQTIVATALHTLQQDLDASVVWAGWTITAYSLGQVLALPLAGRLADRYGRRRVFVMSVVIFTAASFCCGLAGGIYVLVALRAIQAIGGAGFTPAATGIIVDHFGDARDRAVGLFGSIFPAGAVIGPVIGGLFIAYWSWRGIFFVNVPLGLAVIVLCFIYIPADEARGAERSRLDSWGMALLGAGVLVAMLGLTDLGPTDPGGAGISVISVHFIGCEVGAACLLGLFTWHIRRAAQPFIAPRLIYGRGFGVINTINFLYGGAVSGLGALVPLYATERYGIDALNSGTLLSARGVATIVLTGLAVIALRRTGYRAPMVVGFTVTAIGMAAMAIAPPVGSPYVWLAVAAAATGIGLGWANPATRNASLQLAPEQSAAIASLRSTSRRVGSITAIAITTAILAQASHPGIAQAWVFAIFALLLVAVLPLIRRVPEHRGSW